MKRAESEVIAPHLFQRQVIGYHLNDGGPLTNFYNLSFRNHPDRLKIAKPLRVADSGFLLRDEIGLADSDKPLGKMMERRGEVGLIDFLPRPLRHQRKRSQKKNNQS